MKIALLGMTGRTGRAVAELALARGHTVQALARRPERVSAQRGLVVIEGDARDGVVVERVVAGADAVVSALGPARGSLVVASVATGNIVQAMRRHGVKTLVVLSGAAMRMQGETVPLPLRHRMLVALGRLFLGSVLKDKQAEIALLEASPDLDWVLVRPPRLLDGSGIGRCVASTTKLASMRIARADLATFMLDQAEQPTFVRQAPFVAWDS